MMTGLKLIFTLLALGSATRALEATLPLAVTLEGKSFPASILSIGDGQVTWMTQNGPKRTALRQLVYWGGRASFDPRPEILLVDGSVLTLASPLDVRDIGETHVTVESPIWQSFRLRRSEVAATIFHPPPITLEHYVLREKLFVPEPVMHEIVLLNGDRLRGRIRSMSQGRLSIRIDAQDLDVPVERIVGIRLGKVATEATDSTHELVEVGFRDGSFLRGRIERLDHSRMRLKLASGATLETRPDVLPLAEIVWLCSRSHRVVYLSSLPPVGYKHIAFLSLAWPYKLDRNVLGGPLRVAGKHYDRGIGMHSASRLAFELPRGSKRFEAELAIDDSSNRTGSVTFRIFLNQTGRWESVFQSEIVRGGKAPIPCRVDVEDAKRIALVVDFAERGDQGDHANWLNARVIRKVAD